MSRTISYNDINNITTYNLFATGNIAVTAAGNIDVLSGSSLSNGTLTLTSAGGNITQSSRGISATALEANTSGTGGVTLNANNFAPIVAGSAGSGGFSYTNQQALSVGTAGATSGINTSAANGAITLNSTSRELTVSQLLSAGTGNISLSGSFITATAAPITGGGLSLLGRQGGVTVNHAGNDIATLAASLPYAGMRLLFADSNAFTVGTVGSMSGISTKGDITLTATAAGSLLNVTQAISNGNSANSSSFSRVDSPGGRRGISVNGSCAVARNWRFRRCRIQPRMNMGARNGRIRSRLKPSPPMN